MKKYKLNIKYIILGVIAGVSGFSLGQMHKYRKNLSALEHMYDITQQSYRISSVNLAKVQCLSDEINMLQYIENKSVADSLKTSLAQKQDSIANATIELVNQNNRLIQQIAQQHNINIKTH